MRTARWATVATGAVLAFWPAAAGAAGPVSLTSDAARVPIASTYGSGDFGSWTVDGWGLPAYRYTIDEATTPWAKQPELTTRTDPTDAWSQVGNDHITGQAFNHGYTELWSTDRQYQWANQYSAATNHFAGGFGYLRVDGHTISTLHADVPAGAQTERDFGVGYFHQRLQSDQVTVEQTVYAPFGNDPLLLHDVTITNDASHSRTLSWFEYWDVNPYDQGTRKAPIPTGAPSYDAGSRTLSVQEQPAGLSIFASALSGPVAGTTTNALTFFGPTGSRAAPAAVAADSLSDTVPGVPGAQMFGFRAPLTLAPGASVTLRYAYGLAEPAAVPGLVAKYAARPDALARSERAWAAWVPQVQFGAATPWLSRELQWDAYTVRSDATYEECRGLHIISQGGFYQYDDGWQIAFRDPLQHMLPMIWSDSSLARDVIRYSASEQPQTGGQIPYGVVSGCRRLDLGTSDDLDMWLLWGAAEYGLATRDTTFFHRSVPWGDTGSATLWDHLKEAFTHQESQIGPHGEYLTGATGDWSDFSTEFSQMTESDLVTAQAAYVYPRMAELADLYGDHAFASQLRTAGARALGVLRGQWTGRWYARGYTGPNQFGVGEVYEEPQPWAILDGAPSAHQANALVAGIHRYLDGIGAPASLGGPTRIGTALTPAAADPGVTEKTIFSTSSNAGWPGGTWYAINGALTWALSRLNGIVPGARDLAWGEYLRNTLANHADVFPQHWNGLLSSDDSCSAFYTSTPANCGVGLSGNVDGQIMHQPAYGLLDAVKLAGIEPTASGWRVQPELPVDTWTLRLPLLGAAYTRTTARGYVTALRAGRLTMQIAPPAGADPSRLTAYADGRPVPHRLRGGLLVFTLPVAAGRAANWGVA